MRGSGNSKLSIVMYHYVRDLARSRYPEIKGLTTEAFEGQIDYIKKHYRVVSGDELIAAVISKSPLPPKALLLTFDDGYSDHYDTVLPILEREGIKGCFFPPARCILEDEVLDVNKIHFILASVADKSVLVEAVFRLMDENRAEFAIQDRQAYWSKLASASRYDTAEVIFIKRMLQRELPETLRGIIVDRLFRDYVTADEAAFSRELYMDLTKIRHMREAGMLVGSHGYRHYWLDHLAPAAQREEIERSVDFLRLAGCSTSSWMMCYPYGAYNDSLLGILAGAGCKVGLTTEVGVADIASHMALTLPRLDTNDLPKAGASKASEWTLRA